MNAMFQFIGRHTKLDDALAFIAALEDKAEAEKPETGVEDDGNDLAQLKKTVLEMGRDYEQLNSYVQRFLEASTEQNMDGLKESIANTVVDYRSAYDVTIFYSRQWFSLLFFTIDGKIELADYLLGLVKPFGVQNTGTFDAIIAEDPGMLAYIAVPHAK